MHEDALVGTQLRAGSVVGGYAQNGSYYAQLPGSKELDFEQDVFGAVRVLPRMQVALLVPLVATWRRDPTTPAQLGGGVGDVNLSARYDFVQAGESRVVPGIALLAGVTMPTGTPPEISNPIDATGIGAWQLNAALALEQTFGPWYFSAYGIVARRTQHGDETLGTQLTGLAAGAYVFDNDDALALSVAYAYEGDGTTGSGADIPGSANGFTTVTLSTLLPINDAWRVIGGLYLNPPLSSLGINHPAVAGLTYGVIWSWS
jgi:hypothetical protein